jgi:cytoskeletal protein CcmA (bactofilin family)
VPIKKEVLVLEWMNSKTGPGSEEVEMSEEKFELYVGETTKLENTKLNIQGNAKIDGRVSGEIETRLLEIGPNGIVEGRVQANRILLEGRLDSGSGSVVAKSIEIKKGGKLSGRVQYSSFLCHEGGIIDGALTPSEEAADESSKGGARILASLS